MDTKQELQHSRDYDGENRSAVYNVGVGFGTYWRAELTDAATGKVKQTVDWHKNLILNSGLSWRVRNGGPFNSLAYFFNSIAVGTSNVTPVATQTALTSFLASKTCDSSFSTLSPNESDPTAPYVILGTQFAASEAIGSIQELGLFGNFYDNGGYQDIYWSRDLIRDGNGNAITITKTSTDILTVYCKIIIKRTSESALSSSITDNQSTTYTVKRMITNEGLSRALSGYWWSSDEQIQIGSDHTTDPSAGQTACQSPTETPYPTSQSWADPNTTSFYRDLTFIYGTAIANYAGGIGELYLGDTSMNQHALHWRMTFTPALPKTDAKQLTLVFRYTISRL